MRRMLIIALALLALPAIGAPDIPYLTGRAVDNAEILSVGARERLAKSLQAHEQQTGNQIAVLTISSLEGESVEEFAVRVFQVWKLGQKGKDNGVLVLVAPKDRRMRIEVGYGLEGTLTDVAASRIIRNIITPRFKNNDFDGGIEEGVAAIIQVLQGGEAPADSGSDASRQSSASSGSQSSDDFFKGPDLPIGERILLGGFIFGIIGLFTAIGTMTPGATGWFMYFFLIPFWAMFPIMVVGGTITLYVFGAYLAGYPLVKLILRNSDWYRKAAMDLRSKGSASIGGFTLSSGGGSSWSSGSSSGSSGGFSGGGGSSGGGGASGSW